MEFNIKITLDPDSEQNAYVLFGEMSKEELAQKIVQHVQWDDYEYFSYHGVNLQVEVTQ